MVINNRGQVVFYTLMLALVVIVIALALVPVMKQFSDNARASNTDSSVGLDCGNSSISDFQQAQCLLTDLATPYFFFGLLALAGIIIGAKLIIGGTQ